MEQFTEPFQHLYTIKPVKQLADEVHTKPITLYRFGESGEQHRTNPVEYIVGLSRATGDRVLVDCVCHELDGFFVANVPVGNAKADLEAAKLAAVAGTSRVQLAAAEVLKQPESAAAKAELLRHSEALKPVLEQLTRMLKDGQFRRQLVTWFVQWYPLYDAATPGGFINLY